jgi:hypothetical protein
MPKVKQLTIVCENRPGTLARIGTALGNAKVNVLGFNASAAGLNGPIQLVVDNVNKAKKVLKGEGLSCSEELVLYVALPNVPGALGRFARKLAAKDINIGAGYQTTVVGSKKAGVVFAVSHLKNAARVR